MSERVIVRNARLAFIDLFEPKAFPGTDKKRYSASALVEKGSAADKAIWAAIKKVADEQWPKKGDAQVTALKGDRGRFCYQDGDNSDYETQHGHMVLSSHRRAEDGAPKVKGLLKSQDLTGGEGIIYPGCYANVHVDIYAQEGQYKGIRCALVGVQFVKDGQAFGGARRATDDEFDDLEVPDDDEALT